MILVFSLFNNENKEQFHKFFVEQNQLSDLQLSTIANSSVNLLNIVNSTSKINEEIYSSKVFTFTNLFFHVIKFKSYFYFFVTSKIYQLDQISIDIESDFKTLIKKIDEFVNLCTSQDPHFELNQNQYFYQKTENLLIQFNKYLIKRHPTLKAENEELQSQTIKSYFQKSFGKYLVIGSGSAGKSSIIAQFILNWDKKQIENIKPTINKEIHNFKDSLLNHNFNLVDLGGQIQYTELHLKDPSIFKDAHTLIYVIDIQDETKVDFTKKYLLDIIKKLKNLDERPYLSIFLHKFDPEKQKDLNVKIQAWIEWIESNISKMNLEYSYFLTSIKDDSAREAFARTLLFTLPYWFLTHTIKDDLIIRSFNSLSPMISKLNDNCKNEESELIENELFQQSIIFGITATKIIIKKWINHLLNKDRVVDTLENLEEIDDIQIQFNKNEKIIKLKFACPLLKVSENNEIHNFPSVCKITHGLLTGLSQFINLGVVEMLETQIRDRSELCKFTFFLT